VNALARLGAVDRVVVGLSAAGLSSSEIGQVIGMTSSGVRARLGRSRTTREPARWLTRIANRWR
jgi:DNA-directed RNA polymerase specialized sigma24 family protein